MIGSLVALSAISACAGDDSKAKPASEEVFILGKDLIQLLEKDPDAVILVGEQARRYLEGTKERDAAGSSAVVAQQCRIRGELLDNFARLHVEITARAERPGRNPLPLGLSDGILLEASIDSHSPFLTHDSQGWLAWVDGPGQHTIVLDVQIPLGGSPSLPALICAVPEAPVTTLELKTLRTAADVKLTPTAPVTLRPAGDSRPQIEAALGPRGKLDLRWRWSDGQSRELAPLVGARSEVIANIEQGVIQMRTELSLQVLRGSQKNFELRTTADERILSLRKTDGSEVLWHPQTEGNEQRITVQLPEAITGGVELQLVSEVPWSGEAGTIHGLSVQGAYSHKSSIALRTIPDVDVAVTALVGARRAETASATLRSPKNEATFEAHTQPFQLKLSLLPRRSSTTVRTTAVLSFDGEQATIMERWQFSVHGGKVSHVDFNLPAQFEVSDFLPTDAVQSTRVEENPKGRIARVFLKGTPDSFELKFRATVPLVTARNLAKLDLPRPVTSRSEISRLFLASRPEIGLEATAEFPPSPDVLEPALVSELPGQPLTIRGFQSRALLDHVAFRVSHMLPNIRYQVGAIVKLDEGTATVTQIFQFSLRGSKISQLRLAVPESVRESLKLEATPGVTPTLSPKPEIVLQIEGEPADPMCVRLSFQTPLAEREPARDERIVSLPLVRALDGTCDATELAISAPWNMGIDVQGNEWRAIPAGAAQTFPAAEARLTLRKPGSAEMISLGISQQALVTQPTNVVDRALIETRVGPGGEWRTRARYVLSAGSIDKLRFRVPNEGTVKQVRLAGKPIQARAAGEPGTVELLSGTTTDFPVLLQIDSESLAPTTPAPLRTFTWDAPRLIGPVSWGHVLWLLSLPDEIALIQGPTGYCSENRLAWRGGRLMTRPRLDAEAIVSWLNSPNAEDTASLPGEGYLFSRLISVEPISVVGVSRPLLMILSSGSVMVLGIVLVTSSVRVRTWVLFCTMVGMAALLVLAPAAAAECAGSASLGVLLTAIAGAGHTWLARRQSRKRTVFPEPGMLAKAQGSSVRPQPEFTLGNASEAANSMPPAPTTTAPRFATRSSSVR